MGDHPGWYKTCRPILTATIQVKEDEIAVRAATAQGVERRRLWSAMAGVWPADDDY